MQVLHLFNDSSQETKAIINNLSGVGEIVLVLRIKRIIFAESRTCACIICFLGVKRVLLENMEQYMDWIHLEII